eukprot:TRINITY_DN5596_c0_g1_i2.p1 TRINITY_DN5596_c0_g1~~TRINITY_DN5596_c0_g1_i2.p1  ORF type:complete len:463 (-),score=60.43 TRINITY_DN5596_c0_g1_i2:65-1453(-)
MMDLNFLRRNYLRFLRREDDDEESENESPDDEVFEADDQYYDNQKKNLQNEKIAADISYLTNSSSRNQTVYDMIRQREYQRGMSPFSSFDKRKILQNCLPNTPKTLHKFSHNIYCGKFSTDGDLFMSACQDGTITLYDSRKWEILKEIYADDIGWSIIDTDYSPDQKHVAYSTWSDSIHLYSTDPQSQTHHVLNLQADVYRFCVFSLQFAANSAEIVAGTNDRCIYIYDLNTDRRTLKFSAHDADINTVGFAEETSQLLFSGSDDNTGKVWDRRAFKKTTHQGESRIEPVAYLLGHFNGLTHVSSRKDGCYLITNSKDHSIKLWDLRKTSPAPTSSNIMNDRRIFREFNSRLTRRRNIDKLVLKTDSSVMTYKGHTVDKTLVRSYFSPRETTGQKYIYTGCYHGKIYIYDVLTGEIVACLPGHRGVVRDVSWHPYRAEIVSSSWDQCLRSWTYFQQDKRART